MLKKRKISFLALLFILVLSMSLLAGCGAKQAAAPTTPAAPTTTDAPKAVDATTSQVTATQVGFYNRADAKKSCANCHIASVEKYLDTQHPYMVAPYYEDRYFTAFNATTKQGNASAEAIAALAKFRTVAMDVSINAAANMVGDVASKSKAWDANKYKVFSVGQLPIGKVKVATRTIMAILADGKVHEIQEWKYENGKWAPTGGHPTADTDMPPYNDACFSCHALSAGGAEGQPILDDYVAYITTQNLADKPTWDLGITCEACHGEASNHLIKPVAGNIFNPSSADKTAQSRVCGRCHTSAEKTPFYALYSPWKLADTTPQALATSFGGAKATSNADLMDKEFKNYYDLSAEVAANPKGNGKNDSTNWQWGPKDDVSPWGDSRHVGYTSFTTNAHFTNNVVSCGTCHDSHSDNIKGQLKKEEAAICTPCHDNSKTSQKYFAKTSWSMLHDFGKLVYPKDPASGVNSGKFLNADNQKNFPPNWSWR